MRIKTFSRKLKTAASDPNHVMVGNKRGCFGSTSIFNETLGANKTIRDYIQHGKQIASVSHTDGNFPVSIFTRWIFRLEDPTVTIQCIHDFPEIQIVFGFFTEDVIDLFQGTPLV